MFRSPLSIACCAGLSDNELLQLAYCRKDTGVLALLVARRARKRLAIESALQLYYPSGHDDYTIVTAWRTWFVAKAERGAPNIKARRFAKTYARACFITEANVPHYRLVYWTFDVALERLMLALGDHSFICNITPERRVTYVETTEAKALEVARLVLKKC